MGAEVGQKKRPDDLHQAVSNHQSRLSLIDLAVLILARVFVSNRGDDGYDAKCDCNQQPDIQTAAASAIEHSTCAFPRLNWT
jgi:hypothetical protein